MRNHKLKILSLTLLLLSGCSNSGNSGGTGGVPSADEAATLENPVRLDQLGVLPASNSSAASYLLQLTNYSKDKYTLDSVRVIDLDTGKDSELVSAASQACSTVSANGSCSIQLTPHTAKSADVKLEVNLKDKLGVSTKLVQLIRVSGELSANNGGIVMLNDIDRIVTEDGNYSLSIPVVLGESYDEIKASNGSLICNTEGYQKGSSCTYQLSGKISGTSAVVSTRLEGIKAGKTATVQEANTKVEVAKGAHLLLSHGTKINHPESSTEITVFNSGNAAATDIAASVENGSGLKIEDTAANACEETLAQGVNCKIKVSVNSTINGQGAVKVAYKDDGINNTAQTNIRYKVANAVAGVTFTQQSNNLANAIIGGKPRLAVINVKNTGNRTLEGISYYLAPAGSSGLSVEKGAENGCNLTGATLTANESCNLTVKYQPENAFQGTKSINLVINSKYIDQNGQAHSLVSAEGLTYSAADVSSGNLELIKINGNDILSIINNGTSTESATWSLRNTLAADENLPASEVKVALNPDNIEGLKVVPADPNICPQDNTSIAGNSSCEYIVSYGPTRLEKASTPVTIKADYKLNQKLLSNSAGFEVVSSATAQPKINVEVAISGTQVTGDGKGATTPWSFTAYNDKTISLIYTFKNIGNLEAERFNIDTGNLPNGAVVTDKDCSTGADTSSLAGGGGSCTVNVNIPDSELFAKPNLSNLNSATLKLDLPYSYNYNGKIYHGQGDTKYVKFNRLWANIKHMVESTSSTDNSYEFDVKTEVTGLDNAAKSYPITVTPTLNNPISGVTLTSCRIENASTTSCINKISLPKNMFVAGKTLIVTFKTSANGMNSDDVIVSSNEVGPTVVPISNQAGLVAALQGDPSGKLFLLENDIALTGNWTPLAGFKNATFDGQGHKITNLQATCPSNDCGFFNAITGNVSIKNLSLEGKVTTGNNEAGLLVGFVQNGNLVISNSNFKSEVTGIQGVGGVIGYIFNGGKVTFKSVTAETKVTGSNFTGGLVGHSGNISNKSVEANFENIRIKFVGNVKERAGGLVGALYEPTKLYVFKNIIVDAEIEVGTGGSVIGGLIGGTRNALISNIDATVNITGGNAKRLGGIVGNLSHDGVKDVLSNAIARGSLSTSINPAESANRISGIGSTFIGSEVNKAVDMTTIAYNNGTTATNYISPLTTTDLSKYVNSGNVFYFLPAGATYIAAANPTFVAALGGATAEAQKTFLMDKGFDFNNTWTIKKDSANNEFIGIKEDSIPSFPIW